MDPLRICSLNLFPKRNLDGNNHITRRLRGIRAAWYFWYAVVFCGEIGLRKVGLGGTHPLT
ncbi:TPA: hypothetical protein ACGU7V_004459, partial [Vibrio vulnificus]